VDVKQSLVRAYVTQESSNSIGTDDKNKEVYKERREQWMKQRAIQSGTRRMKDVQDSFLPIDQILDCNDLARPHVIAFYIHAAVMSGPLESLSPSVGGSSSSIASAIAYPGMVPRVRPRDRVRGTYQLIFPFAHGVYLCQWKVSRCYPQKDTRRETSDSSSEQETRVKGDRPAALARLHFG
ncbi:hypothetical protein ALC60_13578, partial [Trachymyrmex zeteki]